MSSDVIWALDQRERCIACPAAPVANAVVLCLSADGGLGRQGVESWARRGIMAAGVVWPGATAHLTDDDWLDLEDAVHGLTGLAQTVAIAGDADARSVVDMLAKRAGVMFSAAGDDAALVAQLKVASPV